MTMESTALSERAGVHAVGHIFVTELGWFFREQSVSDFGIDAEVEIAENGKPIGRLLALQIKSGPSFFRKRGSDYVFHGNIAHLDYWTNHSLPVFLILHNPDDGMTLWQKVERRLATIKGDKWSISVPATNVLSRKSKEFLASGTSSDPESIKRYRFSSDRQLMQRIEGKDCFFRFDRWVNKSLSVRGIDVFFDDYEKDESDFDIPIWAAYHTVFEVMAHFFPWLSYEYEEFVDADEGAGEIESHIFRVELNEAAKQFLALEKYFAGETPVYEPAIPGTREESP
jgi:hypothetical protein